MKGIRKSPYNSKLVHRRSRFRRSRRSTRTSIFIGRHNGTSIVIRHFCIITFRTIRTALRRTRWDTQIQTVHHLVSNCVINPYHTGISKDRSLGKSKNQMSDRIDIFRTGSRKKCCIDLPCLITRHYKRNCGNHT